MLTPDTMLGRIYEALKKYKRLSTYGICDITGSTCPSTKISQLRREYGIPIKHSTEVRNKKVIHFYEIA